MSQHSGTGSRSSTPGGWLPGWATSSERSGRWKRSPCRSWRPPTGGRCSATTAMCRCAVGSRRRSAPPTSDVTHRVRTARAVRRPAGVPRRARRRTAGGRPGARARPRPRQPALRRPARRVVDGLVELAETHTDEVFARAVRHWERLADADGAHRAHEDAHAGRTARMALVGDTGYLDARFGAAQFAAMNEVFDRFAQAEFAAEWDELRGRVGDDACPGMLERTEAQRRADALAAIFQRAAATDPSAKDPEPVVNIVIDQAVYEAQLTAMVNGERVQCSTRTISPTNAAAPPPVFTWTRPTPSPPPSSGTSAGSCSTVKGRIINLGYRSRIFTGGARQAAVLQAALDGDGRCLWPGCGLRRCQIDHTDEWATVGSPTWAMRDPSAPATTGSRAAATGAGAIPPGSGTPTAATAPRSGPAPGQRTASLADDGATMPRADDREHVAGGSSRRRRMAAWSRGVGRRRVLSCHPRRGPWHSRSRELDDRPPGRRRRHRGQGGDQFAWAACSSATTSVRRGLARAATARGTTVPGTFWSGFPATKGGSGAGRSGSGAWGRGPGT